MCARKPSNIGVRPNGRIPWLSQSNQNQPPHDPRHLPAADWHALEDQGRLETAPSHRHEQIQVA